MAITRELIVFLYFVLFGMAGGMFFDVLRALRHNRKIGDFAVCLEDIVFWLIMGGGVIRVAYILDAGQIRLYMIMAVFLGMLIYFLTLTKLTYKVLNWLCRYLLWLFRFIMKLFKGANNEKEKGELA